MEKYVYIKEKMVIEKSSDEISLIVDDKTTRKGERLYIINEDALNIITKFTGEYTLKEIIEQLSSYYNEDSDEIKTKLISFIDIMKHNYNLEVEYSERKLNNELKVINNENPYFPRVVSIELTYKCNFKCLHCYGEYDNENYKMMDFEKLKKFILECKDLGVEVIEITGGEITMHPDIVKILEFIHSVGFKLVTVLTNGFVRNEELYNVIIKNKDNTIVQIDMHGNTEDYLTWFTQIPNTKKKVEENIKYLSDNGVYMRIVTIVTPRNLDQVEEIADWVHDLGVKSYAISPVIQTGRANNDSAELLLTSIEDMNKLQELMLNISQKYGRKFLNLVDVEQSTKSNCGGLVSNPTISPDGDIKICAMDSLNILKSIGNVFDEGIKAAYDNKIEYIKKFKSIKSPNFETNGCKECENIDFCFGCVIRAITRGLERGDNCIWLRDMVPEEVKKRLKNIPAIS